MAIAIYVHPENMNEAKYDDVSGRLKAAGPDLFQGRLHHSCFGPSDRLMVYDVWESAEAFETFSQTLMPILAEAGVTVAGPPDVMPVYDMEQ
jgi:hypothetical protein